MGIEIFSLQLLHRKFEIAVCGMFICDNTLLYTVNYKPKTKKITIA